MGSSASALASGILASLYLEHIIPGYSADMMAMLTLSLAGLGTFTALASTKAVVALSRRIDIISRALEAVPEAHLIVTPNGQVGYANVVFDRLFPDCAGTVFDRIERAICNDRKSQAQFRQLRGGVLAGSRAAATLCLSHVPTGSTSWFKITALPIAGYPGYTSWEIRDVTSHHQFETAILDERDRLADLLNHEPIGFYSVGVSGNFLFVNQTLAEWLGITSLEIIARGARLHDFLAVPPVTGSNC